MHLEALLDGYLMGTLSETELKEFLHLVNKEDHFFKSAIDEWLQQGSFTGLADTEKGEMIYRQIMEKKDSFTSSTKEPAKLLSIKKYNWKRLLVAAFFFGFLLFGVWFMLTLNQDGHKEVAFQAPINDVAPGSNKAILTLADGKQIILDSTQGKIIQQGSLKVINLGGKLDYEGQSHTVEYHTLSTPKGGQYKLVLPDDSEIWLNAASSITFPTAFVGKERKVTITGEVYFEVAHDVSKPFIVHYGTMDVRVLGTHFNVNAFEDDDNDIKVTLLEGSVKIKNGNETSLLKPGQQACVNNEIEVLSDVDLHEVMAWKNGYFQFDKASLQSVLKQLARWYDVDVIYQGKNQPREFVGEIERDLNLSEVLKILEKNKVHFSIEGKKLIVKPN